MGKYSHPGALDFGPLVKHLLAVAKLAHPVVALALDALGEGAAAHSLRFHDVYVDHRDDFVQLADLD